MDVLGYGMAGRTLASVEPLAKHAKPVCVLQTNEEYARPPTFRFS